MMADVCPVFLDGPYEGEVWPVPRDTIETGQIEARGNDGPVIYTVTRVGLLGRVVVVASVGGGIPDQATLFGFLASTAAKSAAEQQ